MAGIIVLSDTLKVGSKLEKTSTPKGKDVADGSENAAAGFAAMLNGSMNLNVDPKGQNSTAGQGSEERQSTEDSVPSVQNPNGSGSVLGYGDFVIPSFLQPVLQSDFPAGKEANSGNDVGQGTGGLATANASSTNAQVVSGNNLELAKLNQVSLDSDEVFAQAGMTTPKPLGNNPEITELDKYRTVIADLLVVLSGEIKDLSPKESPVNLEGMGTEEPLSSIQAQNPPEVTIRDLEETGEIKISPKENTIGSERVAKKDFSQDIEYVVQGQRLKTDDVVKDSYAPRVEATSSETAGRVAAEAAVVPSEGSVSRINSALNLNQTLNPPEKGIGGEFGRDEEIKDRSPKESPINLESIETEPLQDTAKVSRGQMPLTNEVVKTAHDSNVQIENDEVQEATINDPEETGEIKTSPKENPIGSERVAKKDFSQDTEHVVQGQRLKTDDVVKDSYVPRVEAAINQMAGKEATAAAAAPAAEAPPERGVTGTNSSLTQSLNPSVTPIGGESRRDEEIKSSSSKVSPINSESMGTKEPGPDIAEVGRGQIPLTNEADKSKYTSVQVDNDVQVAKGEVTLREVPPKALISDIEKTGEIKTAPQENPPGSERVEKKDLSQNTEYVAQGQRLKTDDVVKGSSHAPVPRVEVASGQTILSSESIATKGFSQDMAKVVQGGNSLTNNVVTSDPTTSGQKGLQTYTDALTTGPNNEVVNAKLSMLQATLYPIVKLKTEDLKASTNGKNETFEAEADVTDAISKERLQVFVKPIKGMEDDLFLRKFLRAFSKDTLKENGSSKSSETFGVKAPQYQNSSLGIGFGVNIVPINAETKTVAVPVWQQISNVFSEQVLNRHQQLKELDIQLHPADLGKIQINLRWENGQVHLQVQASEVSTGQILQTQLSELRQTLTGQGVNCGMLQMGQGGERQQNPHGNESQRAFNQNPQSNENEDIIPVINPLPLGQDGSNGIDITA